MGIWLYEILTFKFDAFFFGGKREKVVTCMFMGKKRVGTCVK